jgi:hypothetical protein
MRQEHIDFLELHIINRETIAAGYVKNLDNQILHTYESIYKQYIDADYILTKWCGACVYDCLKRVYDYYDAHVKDHYNIKIAPQGGDNYFVFPDDLDNIIPTDNAVNLLDNKGKRKGRPKKISS